MATLSDDANTPISTVPDEILGDILLMCTDPLPIPHPDKTPIVFTRVSRWFRHVALTTPRLWSNVTIPYSNDLAKTRYSHPQYLALMTDWLLVRSGGAPLKIEFHYFGGGAARTDSLSAAFFSCTERWQNIDVSGIHDYLLLEMAQLHERNTPCLRSLSLRPSDPEFLSYARILLSPKLQRLTIKSSKPFTIHPAMSWTHLTHINLRKFVGPVITLLGQANRLHFLLLDATSFSDENIARNAINLPELVNLSIYGNWNHGLRLFFAYLSSPLLEYLSVLPYDIGGGTPTQLVDFISHTKHLKSFSVRDIDYHSLANILRFTPELKKLSIDAISPIFTMEQSNAFLNAFVAGNVNERVCSHLEELYCLEGLDPDEETLRRLYEQKLGNTSGISAWKTCHIDFARNRSFELLRELGASRNIWTIFDILDGRARHGVM